VISRLLPRRDIVAWTICFLIVSALLVVTRFASDDPDSALYAAQSARLAQEPVSRWIAPEWWGNWDHHGLFREHPVGVLLGPTLLAWFGVPGVQAAYIVGIAAALVSVVLVAALVARVTSVADARAVLVLLQLMPLAFIFRIRANHEYPMLVCLLVAIVGIEAVRRSWRWIWVTPVALCAAVLVKAAFVAVPLLAIGWWMLINPTRSSGPFRRPAVAVALGLVAIVGMSWGYDVIYRGVTGESFWGGYWARQMAPLSIGAQPGGQPGPLHHLGFYALRMLWHPAPWSLLLIAAAWRTRARWRVAWLDMPESLRRGLLFALAFAGTTVLMLVPASRFAERYVFSANYALAALGIVVALRHWPGLRATMARLDERVPAFPAVCWTTLMLLRLVVGPLLPRISG
jgi:4-amino-4-deoxy-L-arabinose transferase-like glycosyltransferase